VAESGKVFIRDLKAKDHLQSCFMVTDKNSGNDRNGKPFISVTLRDSSGQLNGRMFEHVEGVADTFEIGDVVWIKGFVQIYQNRKQIVINDMRRAVEGEFQMSEIVANLGGDPKKHLSDLLAVVAEMRDAHIKQLVHDTLTDPEIEALLLQAPAAKTIHHAYRGGLIEHVHSIVKVMLSLSEHYKFLNRDLLVFGAIYHDLGKIFELDVTDGIRYTQRGRLVGHMVLACEMIDSKAQKIPGFPKDLLDVLKHIVLSHHGKLEYGSPKLPMLVEAVVVAMIDDLDSKMNTMFHFLKSEAESLPATEKWTHFHPGFERYFYLEMFRQKP
jgi:3'-5' exoribonuclease